jgi:hypothetical protein
MRLTPSESLLSTVHIAMRPSRRCCGGHMFDQFRALSPGRGNGVKLCARRKNLLL